MKKKHELEVLKILAEIQNPDKIISDMASQLIYLATERATAKNKTWTQDSVEAEVKYYLNHLHQQLEDHFL